MPDQKSLQESEFDELLGGIGDDSVFQDEGVVDLPSRQIIYFLLIRPHKYLNGCPLPGFYVNCCPPGSLNEDFDGVSAQAADLEPLGLDEGVENHLV